jgi:hypothetical protein
MNPSTDRMGSRVFASGLPEFLGVLRWRLVLSPRIRPAPAGGGGPHQGGTTVMITVSVPKVTRRVTFGTETVILIPRPVLRRPRDPGRLGYSPDFLRTPYGRLRSEIDQEATPGGLRPGRAQPDCVQLSQITSGQPVESPRGGSGTESEHRSWGRNALCDTGARLRHGGIRTPYHDGYLTVRCSLCE